MKALRQLFAVALVGVLAACATQTEEQKDTQRTTLEQHARATLTELYGMNTAARTLSADAEGILVFPSIVEGSFIVGAQSGDGVLFVNDQASGYYNASGMSFGFQAGGQAYSQVLMFMTPEQLDKFRNSSGFQVGVDGGVTVISADMAAGVNTNNLQTDIVAFVFGAEGLAGGVALDGTKYTKKDL
jgi:lipid-binding SYLF domain-containing protein